jgi:hypothetical protein
MLRARLSADGLLRSSAFSLESFAGRLDRLYAKHARFAG